MRHLKSTVSTVVTLACIGGALGCSSGAPEDAVNELASEDSLEWQLDPTDEHTAILDGAQVERSAEQRQEGDLLYEIRLSATKTVQFLEVQPGEVAVSYTGSNALDARPPEEFSVLSPTQLFARITGEPAPERLVAAELAAVELETLRKQSGIDRHVPLVPDGPEAGMTGVAEDPNRGFKASQWWIQTACSGAGIDAHFNLDGNVYHRMVGCWADLFTRVGTGDVGVTLDFRIVGDGTNGSAANMKYWYVNCETFIFEVCEWKTKNYGVAANTWRQLDFGGRRSRAVDYTHPTGGYFAVKYNSYAEINGVSCPLCADGTICPKVNCIYHNK